MRLGEVVPAPVVGDPVVQRNYEQQQAFEIINCQEPFGVSGGRFVRAHCWVLRQQARFRPFFVGVGVLSPHTWWWGVVFVLWIVVASI
jgi:hypothetical protein